MLFRVDIFIQYRATIQLRQYVNRVEAGQTVIFIFIPVIDTFFNNTDAIFVIWKSWR